MTPSQVIWLFFKFKKEFDFYKYLVLNVQPRREPRREVVLKDSAFVAPVSVIFLYLIEQFIFRF
jgi:hypothetical protein